MSKTRNRSRDTDTHAADDDDDANDDGMATKLSPALKALINAPAARPGPCPAPSQIRDVYARIAQDAAARKLGQRPWVVLSAAATFTLNCPDALPALHDVASSSSSSASASASPVAAAELIREVGLKCISFNGIPRTINCLNAFHAALPASVTSRLRTTPTRTPEAATLDDTAARGRALWDSVYAPFEAKLVDKLARAHPDLPVHILHSHYAALLADPPSPSPSPPPSSPDEAAALPPNRLGRVMTSVVAVACLRAQTGVGPQVLSHVFGLRKALRDGTYEQDGMAGDELAAARWLAGDEGGEWLLRSVDDISAALGGSNFAAAAQPRESKL
ncbi:hypothetical protein V2A60_004374 [Cordyceps javanica]|uniref:Mitochondrial protein n=1 Tax=Cordyceps javanica TaxID=43265 RepID=A0A545VQX4_9HYPO|nr:mitochondrial protein [Cordyceps javanica]TQW04141.1 mitochondrial protein [Cordyceps javanica]